MYGLLFLFFNVNTIRRKSRTCLFFNDFDEYNICITSISHSHFGLVKNKII